MRTAQEYYSEAFESDEGITKRDAAILAIKTAMTEVIKEAAEKATVHKDTYAMLNGKRNVTLCAVNKQSILNLLNNIQ